MQTVFEHLGDALVILFTLDEIFTTPTIFREHWNDYKRYTPFTPVLFVVVECC